MLCQLLVSTFHSSLGLISISILLFTYVFEVIYTMYKYPRHYSAIFSGFCCEYNPLARTRFYCFILPLFQQLTTLIYQHWIESFVIYWKEKKPPNTSIISNACKRCENCEKCRQTTICVFCSKNCGNLEELESLNKKSNAICSYSKYLIASTENTLMPLIQLAFLFPAVISNFGEVELDMNTIEVEEFAKDLRSNWLFLGTIFSITSSILSMAASQTAIYFASVGKLNQKTKTNEIIYGLAIILQILPKGVLFLQLYNCFG